MKYAIISASAQPTYCGIGKFSSKITSILLKNNYDVIYLTNLIQNDFDSKSKNLEITPTKGNLLNFGIKDLYSFVKKNKPDYVNIQYQSFHKNYADILFPIVAKIANPRSKIISTIHEFEHFSLLGRIRQVIPMISSDKILFSDKKQMLFALPYTLNLIKNKSKIIEIGPSVKNHLKTYDKNLIHHPKHLHIGFHGHIQPTKGLHFLLDALENYNKPFTLHVLGSFNTLLYHSNSREIKNYHTNLLKQIENNPNLKKNIIVYGDISPESKRFQDILSLAELMIFPFTDSLSIRRSSLFNAFMSSNCIIASTRNPIYTEKTLSSIIEILPSSKSIEHFLNEYSNWTSDTKNHIFQEQNKLKYIYLSKDFEKEILESLV
jgi:hypothetical protein